MTCPRKTARSGTAFRPTRPMNSDAWGVRAGADAPFPTAEPRLRLGPTSPPSMHASEHTDQDRSGELALHNPASKTGTSRHSFGVTLLVLVDSREHDHRGDRRTSLPAGSAFAKPRTTPTHRCLRSHSRCT